MYEINAKSGYDYENALFVIKSISTDETRPFMCLVHVEKNGEESRLICTDGRRLHIADISQDIPEGNYIPLVTKQSIILKNLVEEQNFPNWKRVMPENPTERGVINLEKTSMGRNVAFNAGFSLAYSDLIKKTGEIVNIRYLDDLPKKEWSVLSLEAKHKAVTFKRNFAGREQIAVIMPMCADV